ncbi:hypothetical protein [Allokutzneria albata]|uniref:Secreted protein n=1 Tax=Allokutzneria albata TaxID=211114 RepID=A0A1H0AMJ1_ALLAB|nr:hypothetical protein [Allokutzneria albata]SDN34599.1 hypothetical protein SAMN04489726_6166 [Allokutzneria albata]
MRKQATVLGLAAVIAGATFLAPGTALASTQNCQTHSNGKVCAHKTGNNIEITYSKTGGGEVWVKLGYRQGTAYKFDNTYMPVRSGQSRTVKLPFSAVRNTCVQGAVLPEGSAVANALKSKSFACS